MVHVQEFPDGEDVLEKSQRFQDEKNLVLTKERNVLRVLNFELEMDHPYRYIVTLVKTYAADANQQRQLSQVKPDFWDGRPGELRESCGSG